MGGDWQGGREERREGPVKSVKPRTRKVGIIAPDVRSIKRGQDYM